MDRTRTRLASTLLLTTGLAAGWLVAGIRPGVLRAGGGSRSGKSASAAGPIKVDLGPSVRFGAGKFQAPLDAVYWIDYRGARLYAAIPAARKGAMTNDVALLRDFAGRDLAADFGLAPGVAPRFLIQTASLGASEQGAALLLVVETTTRKIGVYQASPKANTLDAAPDFALLQLASYGEGPPAPESRPEAISTTGPIVIQQTPEGIQSPLEALYWIDHDARGPKLHAAVPTTLKVAGAARIIGEVGETDLARDFGLKPGATPQFLLNAASLGASVQGSAALWVIETTTKQVAVYRASPKAAAGGSTRSDLDLIQIKSYLDAPPPPAGN